MHATSMFVEEVTAVLAGLVLPVTLIGLGVLIWYRRDTALRRAAGGWFALTVALAWLYFVGRSDCYSGDCSGLGYTLTRIGMEIVAAIAAVLIVAAVAELFYRRIAGRRARERTGPT